MGQYFTNFAGDTVGAQPANTSTPWNGGSYVVNTDLGFNALRETHAGNAEYALIWNRIPTAGNSDVEILFKARTTYTENTGVDYQIEAVLRGAGSAGSRYGYTVNMLRALYTNIEGYQPGSFTLGGGNNFSFSANTWYWIRARFEVGGGTTTTVRYKVWADGNSEPGGWTEQYADNRFSHDGWIGVSSYRGAGNRYYAQVGIGWNGESAPSSMPAAYLGASTATELNGDSSLTASGTIIPMGANISGDSDMTINILGTFKKNMGNNFTPWGMAALTSSKFIAVSGSIDTFGNTSAFTLNLSTDTGSTFTPVASSTATILAASGFDSDWCSDLFVDVNLNAWLIVTDVNSSAAYLIKWIKGAGDTWTVSSHTMPNSNNSTMRPSVVVDKDGVVHTHTGFANAFGNSGIIRTTPAASPGVFTATTPGGIVGDSSGPKNNQFMELRSNGYPVIAYTWPGSIDLSLTAYFWNGSTWATNSTLQPITSDQLNSRDGLRLIGLPNNNTLAVGTVGRDKNGAVVANEQIWYTLHNGTSWSTITVLDTATASSSVLLSKPHITTDGTSAILTWGKRATGTNDWTMKSARYKGGVMSAITTYETFQNFKNSSYGDGGLDYPFSIPRVEHITSDMQGWVLYARRYDTGVYDTVYQTIDNSYIPTDNFNDNVMDGNKWTRITGATGQEQETGGKAQFTTSTGTTGTWGFRTIQTFPFSGERVIVEVPQVGNNTTSTKTWLRVYKDASNYIQVYVQGATLYGDYLYGGGSSGSSSIGYNSTTHRWWSIRESAGLLYTETSPDGINWTARNNIGSANPFGSMDLKVEIAISNGASEGSTATAQFDNFNLPPPITVNIDGGSDMNTTGGINFASGALNYDSDSTMTVIGDTAKVGVPNIMSSTSWMVTEVTTIGVTTSSISQTSYNSLYNTYINSTTDDKVVGQSFTVPAGLWIITGFSVWLSTAVPLATDYTLQVYNNLTDMQNQTNIQATRTSGGMTLNSTTPSQRQLAINPATGIGPVAGGTRYFRINPAATYGAYDISYQNSNVIAGDLYLRQSSGTSDSFHITPYSGVGTNSDLAYTMDFKAVATTWSGILDEFGDSTLTADGNRISYGDMTQTADSTMTVSAQATFATGMTNNGDSDMTVSGVRIVLGTFTNNGDSDLTVTGNAGYFSTMNETADSTLTASLSLAGAGLAYLDGNSDFTVAGQRTGVIAFNELGDSTLTAVPTISYKAIFNELGDSNFTAVGTRIVLGVMTNNGDSTFDGTVGLRIPLGIVNLDSDSTLSAFPNVGYYSSMNQTSDSTLTAVGSKIWYSDLTLPWVGDSNWSATGVKIRLGIVNWSGGSDAGVDSTGTEITHLAITKNYVYKIYDKDWNYIGIWKDVVSDFGYSQEINSAGSAISVVLARNSDSKIAEYSSLGTDDDEAILTDDNNELAAELETVSSIGPGTDVDLNHNVKVYEFSTDPGQSIDGDLVFTGYISMYTSKYGSSENTTVSIFSYGADLDNWLLRDDDGLTRVSYLSQDPSDILRDTLDRFNADGGIVTYDPGVPGASEVITNLIHNPSFQTNTTGWTLDLGYGGRATDINGGAVGDYYLYLQNGGGGRYTYQTPSNLVSGSQYRLSLYLKRPAGGFVEVVGGVGVTQVFDLIPSLTTTWQRYDVLFTAPSAAPLNFSVNIAGSDNVVYIDGVMLTQGSTLYDYIDGTQTSADPAVTYSWNGTANISTSKRTTILNNIGASIDDTNTIATYSFNVNTELEVIKKGLELAPTDWYFYADLATNLLHFHGRPEEPNHYFYLGKHILGLDLEKSMEGIINDVIITGGKPLNVAKDNFFAATGTALEAHEGEIAAHWAKHPSMNAGSMVITANRARMNSGGEVAYLVEGQTTSNDYTITADMRTMTSAVDDIGLILRANSTNTDWYMARLWQQNNTAEILKRVGGTWTSLRTQPFTMQPNTTYKLEFKAEGSQLTFKVDGNSICDVEDASIIYGNRAGFRGVTGGATATSGQHFNNFNLKHFGSTGIPIFKRYYNQDSIDNYRRGLTRVQDNRIEVLDSARIIAESQINRNKEPRYRSSITISGNTYPIRTIKLGDLVAFRNFDNFVDFVTMQVVRIDYSGNEVKLQLDTLLPSVPKRLEDIKRNLNQEQVDENPDEPAEQAL